MKKTIIISAIALSFTFGTLNANPLLEKISSSDTELTIKASPFHLSIVKGDFETVKKLIDLGSDVNEKWNGLTPVMYAARFNRTEILKLLISKGANLKTRSEKGYTAIEYAELSNAQDAINIIETELEKK